MRDLTGPVIVLMAAAALTLVNVVACVTLLVVGRIERRYE